MVEVKFNAVYQSAVMPSLLVISPKVAAWERVSSLITLDPNCLDRKKTQQKLAKL